MTLPILKAPARFVGRTTKHTAKNLRADRLAWMLAQTAKGYTPPVIAAAIGISEQSIRQALRQAGWRWSDTPRQVDRSGRAARAALRARG